MSCRSVPGMSVPMGLANIDSGLDDEQIQSLVHQLRHEYAQNHGGHDDAEETSERWNSFRQNMATRVGAHPTLRPQRRAGLLLRLDAAAAAPPADMLYAAERIRERSIRTARSLDDHLATESARIGIPDAQAFALYELGRNQAPRGRQPRATADERRQWPGLPLDPRTRHGLAALANQPDNPDGNNDLISNYEQPQAESVQVAASGYHSESHRLEILTAEGNVLAYRNVPPAVAAGISHGPEPDAVLRDQILGNGAYQYRDAIHAATAGVRRRCQDCGQFCGASHNCLGRRGRFNNSHLVDVTTLSRGTLQTLTLSGIGDQGQDMTLQSYPLEGIVEGLETNRGQGVEFVVLAVDGADPAVAGSIAAQLDGDDALSVSDYNLMCTCAGYAPLEGCPHTQRTAAALRTQLGQTLIASRQQVAQATSTAITTRPATDSLLPSAPNLSTFSYAEDPARFAAQVRQVMSAADDQVPWMSAESEPAMYGFGADRKFGVELEFEAEHYNAREARANVGSALYEAGFTRTYQQMGYHSAARAGYNETIQRGYTYETDGSLQYGGEVVTPILSNNPDSWNSLNQVCQIITNNGGIASETTGSHITISSPEQAGMAARLTRFLRLLAHHQSDLHVMAASGYGRGTGYAAPVPTPPLEGYNRIIHAQQNHHRYSFVNLAHIAQRSTDPTAAGSRIEFRLWDGSLEPGRIQAQVKMSAALLDYSSKNRALTFDAASRPGSAVLNPDRSDFEAETVQVRTLIDSLFRRDSDKEQAAALWASGVVNRNGRREAVHR